MSKVYREHDFAMWYPLAWSARKHASWEIPESLYQRLQKALLELGSVKSEINIHIRSTLRERALEDSQYYRPARFRDASGKEVRDAGTVQVRTQAEARD